MYSRGEHENLSKRLIELLHHFPNSPILYNVQGALNACSGNIKLAESAYKNSLLMDPEYHAARKNLGKLYLELGDHTKAEQQFNYLIEKSGEHEDGINGLAMISTNRGNSAKALTQYQKVLDLNPDNVIALTNSANILYEQGKIDSALTSIERALNLSDGSPDLFGNLCSFLERSNKLHELQILLDKPPYEHLRNSHEWTFYSGVLANRLGNNSTAIKILTGITPEVLTARRQRQYHATIGRAAVECSLPQVAMSAFEKMNSLIEKEAAGYQTKFSKERNEREEAKKRLGVLKGSKNTNIGVKSDTPPIFMVGFPRSGTTLLDTLLRGSDEVELIEEKPFVSAALKKALKLKIVDSSNPFTQEQKKILYEEYYRYISNFMGVKTPGKKIVDKLPLNIELIAFIYEVFNSPKIILSLRHPYDCILSCYFQNFENNTAMSRMTSLSSIAIYYAEVMTHWLSAVEALNLDHIVIRYENLVEEPSKQLKDICEFLGIQFVSDNFDNVTNAKSRNRINTPSYRQVGKPIYKSAINRWQQYESYLVETREIIEPISAKLGYKTAF